MVRYIYTLLATARTNVAEPMPFNGQLKGLSMNWSRKPTRWTEAIQNSIALAWCTSASCSSSQHSMNMTSRLSNNGPQIRIPKPVFSPAFYFCLCVDILLTFFL